LAPQWDEEFRFDILDDTVLQDEPLLVKVLDDRSASHSQSSHPPSSANHPFAPPDESLGVAYVDLNPLLTTRANDSWHNGIDHAKSAAAKTSSDGIGRGGDEDDDHHHHRYHDARMAPRPSSPDPRFSSWGDLDGYSSEAGVGGGASLPATTSHQGVTTIEGWLPLYDTLQGVRGEVLVSIKLNLIGDVNPFRDSSAGVRLLPFSTLDPASGYAVRHIFGAFLLHFLCALLWLRLRRCFLI
jgi:hypothetical protein